MHIVDVGCAAVTATASQSAATSTSCSSSRAQGMVVGGQLQARARKKKKARAPHSVYVLHHHPLPATTAQHPAAMVKLRSSAALALPPPALSTSTRSISRSFPAEKAAVQGRKRVKGDTAPKATESIASSPPVKKAKREAAVIADETALPLLTREEVVRGSVIAYPTLPFRLSDAVQHLRSVDVRFHSLLDRIELKPYKELEDGQVKELDLFRTLASSVVGQQVSWLAARAIIYRFVRLFFPNLPEKPDFNAMPRDELPFPHPLDVAADDCTDERLRGAGLSGAKVKYIKDIARRFSDGRLDVRKIVRMQEEECIQELVKIKGVGKWTAEMLLIFALRRADILPVGDLGVQRGIVLFYLADSSGPKINKRKKKPGDGDNVGVKTEEHDIKSEPIDVAESHVSQQTASDELTLQTGPAVAVPKCEKNTETMQELPEGITMSMLQSRKDGKKAKGNVYLT